ncbi:hypothetical protein BH09PSE1_BH09PSE1_17660 [soil metagenome]
MPRDTTVEDLEEYWALLNGRMKPVIERASAVISQKMRERGVEYADLSSDELRALVHASLLETAADLFPNTNLDDFERKLGLEFEKMALAMAANADGGDALN